MYKRRVKRPIANSVGTPVANVPLSINRTPDPMHSLHSSTNKLLQKAPSPTKPLKERKDNVTSLSNSQNSNSKKRNLDEESSSCEIQLSKMFRVTSESTKLYFQEVLSSCGFEVDDQNTHVLTCDQGIFLRDLKSKFEGSICLSSMVDGFLKSFEEYCENEDNFKKSLQLTKSKENENTCKTSQDSLIHLLLSLDCLQKRLIEFLCEKLVLLVCSDDRNEGGSRSYPWTQMILRQFKFLDHVVNPEEFLTMLFDVLDSVPDKGDVLLCLPDIIQDSQHEDTAKRLSELLLHNSEMREITPSILDALTNLTLTSDVQRAVAEDVIKWLGAVPLEYLPNMVRFLVTNTSLEDMPKIISKLRLHLDFSGPEPLASQTAASAAKKQNLSSAPGAAKSCVVLTTEVLKLSVMSSQAMAEAWLTAIKAVRCASEHRPIDVALLLVLEANVPNTRPVVQALFRAKAKALLFGEKLLVKTFAVFLEVIKEYCTTVMELLFVLLRSPDPAVVQHASCWYKLCLLKLPSWQGQAVVQRLLLHVGSGNAASRQAALQVFMGLASENLNCLIPHQRLLLNLLDKIPDVDLNIAEMILEVLCSVAFGSDSSGGTLGDNLLMLARKQLSSRNREVRQKGVIGAILASKHMASKDKETDESLDDTIKQAIHLMELVTATTTAYPDATGLFLDKLSSVLCNVEVLDETFLVWICTYIGQSFEQKYVVTVKGLKLDDDLKLMLSADDPDQADDDDVCIPVAHLVDRDNFNRRNQNPEIMVMHSSLRLVRCVKWMACDGSLHDVAPLLTCAVVLPRVIEQEDWEVDFICPQEQNFLLDCLFHCVNWFRELISAFASQKDPEIRQAVLLRLRHLVRLEDKLSHWLYVAMEYTPPPCQFYDVAKIPKPTKVKKSGKKKAVKRKKTKTGKKKKKLRSSDASQPDDEREEGDEEEEETVAEADAEGDVGADADVGETNLKHLRVDLSEYRSFLREIDVDMLILLTEPLLLPASSQASPSESGLSSAMLLFLLKDFNAKVEHLLAPEAKRISALKAANVKPLGFANLNTFAPRSFVRNTVRLLPALCEKLESIGEYCEKLLESSDNIRDAPSMFPDNGQDVKLSYAFILRIIAGLFNWSGFESELNADYLKDALKILVRRSSEGLTQQNRLPELLKRTGTYLLRYTDKTLLLAAACSLVKLLSALCRLTEDEAASEQIAKTCKTFLSQQWFNLKGSEEKGAIYNQQVDYLIKELFSNVPKLKTVSNLVSVVYQEVESFTKCGSKDWKLNSFPTISKNNFLLLFRALCSALVQGAEEMLEVSANDRSTFKVWEVAVDSLRGLMMIARLQNSRSNLIAFVKNSLRFLRLFLKRGIPLFGRLFKSRSTEVTAVLQALQKSTRFLNSVCYHSKATKDKTLTSQVPTMRLVLEQIVVDVRSMLARNNCRDAFWVGVLKNRNLQGEEVLSQQSEEGESMAEEGEKDDQEEDLPSDEDSDVDVDLGGRPRDPEDEEEDEDEDKDKEESSMSDVF